MALKQKIVVRKSPPGWHHLYTASVVRGNGVSGWGNTPAEARAKLAERLAIYAMEATLPTPTSQRRMP